MNNKKGISPLIATVLIIGFTIVVAVLVITWINNLVGSQTETQGCTADALKSCTDANRFLTYDVSKTAGSEVTGSVSNSGPIDAAVKVIYLGATGNTISIQDVSVTEYSGNNTKNSTAGITQVRFVVEVEGTYKDITCTEVCGDGVTKPV